MSDTPILGWWCGPPSGCLARPLDGETECRRIVIGETLRVAPPIRACERGLHASRRLLDALSYAQGETICLYRVEFGGELDQQPDKVAAECRTALGRLDAVSAERELRLFACDAAEYAFAVGRKAGQEPDPRSVAAVDTARRYATGTATKDEFAAATPAARAAWAARAIRAAWAARATCAACATWAATWAADWAADWAELNAMAERRILAAMGLPVPAAGQEAEAAR